MTSSLAASFRALFPAIVVVAALAVVGGSGLLLYLGYGLPAALGLLLIGGIALVALFGMVAIQIDNNELLAVMAEAIVDARDGQPVERAAAMRVAPSPAQAAATRSADPLVLRPAPTPAAKAPAPRPQAQPRVEPMLTARRG